LAIHAATESKGTWHKSGSLDQISDGDLHPQNLPSPADTPTAMKLGYSFVTRSDKQ